jgi:dynein light chain Tctex-type 1
VTSYSHASTEEWNTTIINEVLGTLVGETTPPAGDQPPWKFVVNSTIIQHGSSSSAGNAVATGRRGMHAASGAFWNNDKDGMWSYKYSAADSKGLDVVVGIIWVWVG